MSLCCSPFLNNSLISCSKNWQAIPKSDEGESKEKAKSSSEFSNQGGERVDQLLRLDVGLLRDGPQRESKIFRFGAHPWFLDSNKLVLPVLTRLQAPCQLGDVFQICCNYFVSEQAFALAERDIFVEEEEEE